MTNPSTSIRRLSCVISQLHVLKSFMERHTMQLQDYTTNNMSTDSFLLQDEELLELIEEFNGCDQRMYSENVLEMLECELSVLESIEETYEFLVGYTKLLCSRSHEFGFSEAECKEFMKSNLVREQQKYMQKMRSEEKRLKGKRKKLFSVYSDAPGDVVNSAQSVSQQHFDAAHHHKSCSPAKSHNSSDNISMIQKKREPTIEGSDFVISSSPTQHSSMSSGSGERMRMRTALSEKENISHHHFSPGATKRCHPSSYNSAASSIQETPPLQVRYPLSSSAESASTPMQSSQIFKPRTPIQKVLTPSNCDTRSTHIQSLNVQFRRYLVKQAYQVIVKLGELKPTDSQFKQYKQHLEKLECDLKLNKDRHVLLCNQLATTTSNGSSIGAGVKSAGRSTPMMVSRAPHQYWRDEGMIF